MDDKTNCLALLCTIMNAQDKTALYFMYTILTKQILVSMDAVLTITTEVFLRWYLIECLVEKNFRLLGGFRVARLPGQVTCVARMVGLWAEKNLDPPPNCQALDWSVVFTVGWLCPIVPQDNIVVSNKHN